MVEAMIKAAGFKKKKKAEFYFSAAAQIIHEIWAAVQC